MFEYRKKSDDDIEWSYKMAIWSAGEDSDLAYELSSGLKEYREYYKVDHVAE